MNGITDEASSVGPCLLVSAFPRLAPRSVGGKICRRDDCGDAPVPLGLVDLAGLKGLLGTLGKPVGPVLYDLD